MIRFDLDQDITDTGCGGPDLTPLIDMVFILLVFFLLTSVVFLPAIQVELPEARTGEPVQEIDITISVDPNGTIYVNNREVTLERLGAHLTRLAEENRVEEVILHADTTVPYGNVVKIIDIARERGFESISFIVDPE